MHRTESPVIHVDLGLSWALFGRVTAAGLSGRSTDLRSSWPRWAGGQAAAVVGGPSAPVNRASQASAQGQLSGSRSVVRRAERTGRAGTLISWRRIVAVVARAWKWDASA